MKCDACGLVWDDAPMRARYYYEMHLPKCISTHDPTITTLLRYLNVHRDEHGCLLPTRNVVRVGGRNWVVAAGARVIGEKYAHRASFVLTYGSIPEGLDVSHICAFEYENGLCIRPSHLTAESRSANLMRADYLRRSAGGRASAVLPRTDRFMENARRMGKEIGSRTATVVNTQRWQCLEPGCEKVCNAGPLAIHQKYTGHTGRERIA